jgi:hypothetical protein
MNDNPFSRQEAEFPLESATTKELEILKEGGYDLPAWEERAEGYEEIEETDG